MTMKGKFLCGNINIDGLRWPRDAKYGLSLLLLSLQIFVICKCVFKSIHEFSNMQELTLLSFHPLPIVWFQIQ